MIDTLPGSRAVAAVPARPICTMPIRIADLYKIGIGPSSSHTMGPMMAASMFRRTLACENCRAVRLTATAHGSLAWTGKGHATDRALVLGLAGERPETLDIDRVSAILAAITDEGLLHLSPSRSIRFDAETDIIFDFGEFVGRHPNALTFTAFDADGATVAHEVWYSVGGGFIEREGEVRDVAASLPVPFPYMSARNLLDLTVTHGLSIAAIVLGNETVRTCEAATFASLDSITQTMFACIERGLGRRGILPGGLAVRRRAAEVYERLMVERESHMVRPHRVMDYVSAYAMAVNEENADGGRVVTAPTNGASGVLPAVLRYYRDFCDGDREGMRAFLLTAGAIGDLIKRNASISGAEVGCQGEVGSAAAMAAGGLCAILGGKPAQVLNAAEIGLEHHLGMTCDPIGGLVQIPCIERNAFGAIKAINAASLALHGDGKHFVSLDQVIETMLQTGRDMKAAYRETSRGGLAVNVPEC